KRQYMTNTRDILASRLAQLDRHFSSFRDYKALIDDLLLRKNIYDTDIFLSLEPAQRAILDAYLKRFSSIQDMLGAKIFPLLLAISGIGAQRMSDVLENVEKEGIIDSLDSWIELLEIRNDLEHEYPDSLSDALKDLMFCVDSYGKIKLYCENSSAFAARYGL
ncbi:MAG: hypothetical protein Q8O19_01570, partial [Rectinemataceae bacterium]|nr:hypothetical protein [Rectinemataceae bacterium]